MKRYMCVLLALNTLFGQQEATKAPSAPALNAGAKEAVALSESWTSSSGSRPGSGADGRVVYPKFVTVCRISVICRAARRGSRLPTVAVSGKSM